MELYSVATGNVSPSNMASTAVKFVNGLPGMVGVHTAYGIGTLWMFDSLDHARSARKQMDEAGILTGNICRTNINRSTMCKYGIGEDGMMDNDRTMSLGEATAIFDMAFRCRIDFPDDEIMQAIRQVAKMETINSITKQELLEAIRFLIERVK